MKTKLMTGLLAGTLLVTAPWLATAADQADYGRNLMTQQERAEHQKKMRSFKTEREREEYRKQYHEQMKERAKEQGKVLPDQPLPRGGGMGRGR